MVLLLADPSRTTKALSAMTTLLSEIGCDAAAVLSAGGLDPAPSATGAEIGGDRFLTILGRAAAASGREHIGLDLAPHHDVGLHGIGRRAHGVPTVRAALGDSIHGETEAGGLGSAFLHPLDGVTLLGWRMTAHHRTGTRQAYDLAIATLHRLVRRLSDGRVRPLEISLCCRPPANPAAYCAVFGTTVRFNQVGAWIAYASTDLDMPLSMACRLDHAPWGRGAVRRDAEEASISTELKRVLRCRIGLGGIALQDAARAMGLHPRTLGRRLEGEGTSFQEARDDVRYVLARELLQLTDLPVGDIAEALAYASHSAFVHSFRRWSGTTPSEWRLLHEDGFGGPVAVAS